MAEPASRGAESLSSLGDKDAIKFVELQFTDVEGMVKNLTVPADGFDSRLEKGICFDGSSIEGYARVAESDMYLVPDRATFSMVPWRPGSEAVGRFICDVRTPDGQPYAGDPRAALLRALEEAKSLGFEYRTSPEMEFFLLKTGPGGEVGVPIPHDSAGYFDAPSDTVAQFRSELMTALASFGIPIEAMHHEVAGGQHEIDFLDAGAMAAADNTITFRVALKAIAQRNGLHGTFMPKPFKGASGSGMHVHQGLAYAATGADAFSDPGDPHGLSMIAKHFIAGQLAHARGMCAILAPLVNSYKRLVTGYEAPVHISWARINRGALIRVPRSGGAGGTRIELRCPDPSCNPYLAFAVMLAAGLDGIRRELPPVEATEENPFSLGIKRSDASELLPFSLEEAIRALEEDEVVRAALGPHIARRLIESKKIEWEEFYTDVTPWEISKYLNNY